MVTVRAGKSNASMRPPAKRRKNGRGPADTALDGRRFNEAACKEAEKLPPPPPPPPGPARFNEAACKEAEKRGILITMSTAFAASMRPPAKRRKNALRAGGKFTNSAQLQ